MPAYTISARRAAKLAAAAKNLPAKADYVVLLPFAHLHVQQPEGTVLSLTAEQAKYHVLANRLALKADLDAADAEDAADEKAAADAKAAADKAAADAKAAADKAAADKAAADKAAADAKVAADKAAAAKPADAAKN